MTGATSRARWPSRRPGTPRRVGWSSATCSSRTHAGRRAADGLPPRPGGRRAFRRAVAHRNLHRGSRRGGGDDRPRFRIRRWQTGSWSYDGDGLRVHVGVPTCGRPDAGRSSSCGLEPPAPRCYGRSTLTKGESAFVALSWSDGLPQDLRRRRRRRSWTGTVTYWRDWLSNGDVPDHPWRIYMERSALTLKGLSYAPTGAIMAAATTSLPRHPAAHATGTTATRGSATRSFMLRSLYRLGFTWEAMEYFAFVLEAVAAEGGGDWDLQIMYGIDGRKDLTEHTLDHLSGWRNSRPVQRWQRGVGPAPERRLGDAPRRGGHPPSPRCLGRSCIPSGRDWRTLVRGRDLPRRRTGPGIWEIRGDPRALHRIQDALLGRNGPGGGPRPDPTRHRPGRAVAQGSGRAQGRDPRQGRRQRMDASASTTATRNSMRRSC